MCPELLDFLRLLKEPQPALSCEPHSKPFVADAINPVCQVRKLRLLSGLWVPHLGGRIQDSHCFPCPREQPSWMGVTGFLLTSAVFWAFFITSLRSLLPRWFIFCAGCFSPLLGLWLPPGFTYSRPKDLEADCTCPCLVCPGGS